MSIIKRLPWVLFGLVFVVVGGYIFQQTAGSLIVDWFKTRSWQAVDGVVLVVSGEDNQTLAQYRYVVNGHEYTGSRVYLADFNDNIGSYHRKLQSRLSTSLANQKSIEVWVEPENLNNSVLDRDMRWGLLTLITVFCGVFIGIGSLVLYGGWRSGSRPNKPKELGCSSQAKTVGSHANRAWQQRKGWQTQDIYSSANTGVLVYWFFTVVIFAASSPGLFALPDELNKGNYAILLVLLFPLAGCVLFYQSMRKTLDLQRYGKVPFHMDPYPGAIGGHVGGNVIVNKLSAQEALAGSAQVTVRLECVYSYISGSGKNRSRRETIKWAEEGQPHIQELTQGTRLSFHFSPAENLPEADIDQSDAYHFWRLTVSADVSGVDLERQYNIPVFKSVEQSRFIQHDISAQVTAQKVTQSAAVKTAMEQGDFNIAGLTRAARVNITESAIRLHYPMFRNKMIILFAAIFSGGFGFASISMLTAAGRGGMLGIGVGLFTLPFLLVAVIATVGFVYMSFNNLRVDITATEVSIVRRLLFIPIVIRRMSVTEGRSLSFKRSGSTGQGVDKVEHFKVSLHDYMGRKTAIAEDIDGEDVAKHFCDYLTTRYGWGQKN